MIHFFELKTWEVFRFEFCRTPGARTFTITLGQITFMIGLLFQVITDKATYKGINA